MTDKTLYRGGILFYFLAHVDTKTHKNPCPGQGALAPILPPFPSPTLMRYQFLILSLSPRRAIRRDQNQITLRTPRSNHQNAMFSRVDAPRVPGACGVAPGHIILPRDASRVRAYVRTTPRRVVPCLAHHQDMFKNPSRTLLKAGARKAAIAVGRRIARILSPVSEVNRRRLVI